MLQRLLCVLLWLQLISALPSRLQPQAKQNAVVAKTQLPTMAMLSKSDTQASLALTDGQRYALQLTRRQTAPKTSKGAKGGKGGKNGGGVTAAPAPPPASSSGGSGGPRGPAIPIPGLDNLDSLTESIGHDLGKTIGNQIGASILGDTLGGKVGTSLGNLIGGKIGKSIGGSLNDFLSNGGLDNLISKALGGILPAAKVIELAELGELE